MKTLRFSQFLILVLSILSTSCDIDDFIGSGDDTDDDENSGQFVGAVYAMTKWQWSGNRYKCTGA